MESPLVVKLARGSTIVRVSVSPATLAQVAFLSQAYLDLPAPPLVYTYADEDGDVVTILDDAQLALAASAARGAGRVLRIDVRDGE